MRSISTIKENRGYVWFALSLFGLGVFAGVVFFHQLNELLQPYLEKIKRIAEQGNQDSYNLAVLLFQNNLKASLGLLLSGVFLSIFSIGGIVFNGMLVGYALALMAKAGQIPMWGLLLFGILPHGVLEIPAFLLAGAMGIKLGYMWLRPMVGKTRWKSFRYSLKEAIYVLPVIVLLLVVAAVIEGFVTPQLLSWYIK